MIKSIIKRQVFSFSWVLEWFLFCFVFEKMCSSIPILLVMLFAHVGKRSNSRSQMFFRTSFLKNFAIFTGKYLCWSLFLIRFQDWRPAFLFKKRLQHRFSFCQYCKIFKNGFFYRRPVHYTIPKFYLIIDNWYFRVRFCYCKLCFYKDL